MSSQCKEKIKVFARIRPSMEEKVQKVARIENNDVTLSLNGESKSFQFDGIFGEESAQEAVFDGAASRIVHGALQGYNGTIFAYGQTGSGKTHTMIGPSDTFDEHSGIIPRGLQMLFEQLDEKREELPGTFTADITVSFVEIYNENIYDLFTMNDEKLKIGQDHDGNAIVKGATEIFVKDLNDAMEEVKRGWNNRTVGSTAMNRHSSRSHALLLIKILTEEVHGSESSDRISTVRSALLNLVDLAGSERVSQSKVVGEQFKETASINKSLLQLKIVIRDLSERKFGHIPFRSSVLTHILKDSLGGNARTAVMINIHPDKMYYSETLSTLQFSGEVRRIENKVVVNENLKGESVNAYKAEIKRLQEEMEKIQHKSAEEVAEMKRSLDGWIEAANILERKLAVARRNVVNAAIIARKDGLGASIAESIWKKSMAEIAESARKLPCDNKSMRLRQLDAELENVRFENDDLQVQLEIEKKAKMELQERLNRYIEGVVSPRVHRSTRIESASSQDEGKVSSMPSNPRESQLFTIPSSAARKERRRTRYTPAIDRQSNFFRPVLEVNEEDGEQPSAIQQTDSFEERELKLELEVNTQKQIIDEKIQECDRLRCTLEKAEKRASEVEETLKSALSTSENKVKELTADIEKVKKTIREENEKFVVFEKRSNELEGQLMEANGQIERLQSDMDLMRSTHLDEMKELETSLKSNLSNKEKKEVDLHRELEGVKSQLKSKTIELTNKDTEKKIAIEVLSQLRKEKNENMAELESITCQMEELKEAAENERKMMDDRMKEYEEERKNSEDEYRGKIKDLEKEIETKRIQLIEKNEKMQQLGESSSAQLTRLQEEMNNLCIAKDAEIRQKTESVNFDEVYNDSYGEMSNHEEEMVDDDNVSLVEEEDEEDSSNDLSINEDSEEIAQNEDELSNNSVDDGMKKSSRRVSSPVKCDDSMEDSDEEEDDEEETMMKKTESKPAKKRGKSNAATKKRQVLKKSDTDLECIECEYHTRSAGSWLSHLRFTHNTTPALSGLALRCECGTECTSASHSRKCDISNFTVIRKNDGPIRRLDDVVAPQVKCVLCEAYPKTAVGFIRHLQDRHKDKSTLKANGIYLRCSCGLEIFYKGSPNNHSKECNGQIFSIHNLKEVIHSTPQCIFCEKYPSTAYGYGRHIERNHETTLKEAGYFLVCSLCNIEIKSRSREPNHAKECNGPEFTLHKLDEE